MRKMIARQKITETEQTIEMDIQVDPNADNSDWRAIYAPKKHYFNNGDFATIFQPALLALGTPDLSKIEFRILLVLLGSMRMGNEINTSVDLLSKGLLQTKGNVSTALKKLEERNIIIREKDGNTMSLKFDFFSMAKINSNLAHKGKIKDYKKGLHPKILTTQKQVESEKYKQLEFDNFNDRINKEQ